MTTPSRRWDKAPETPTDTQFFDLRAAGYHGPIDQNGRPVTAGPAAEILTHLAQQRSTE